MSQTEFEVIPQIKRSVNTVTGKMFKYLVSNPMEMGLVETVVYTLKAFWLPLAMHSVGIGGEELRKVALWAIGVLESQIQMIKRVCGLEEISQLVLITPMVVGQSSPQIMSSSVVSQEQVIVNSNGHIPQKSVASSEEPSQEEELDGEDDFFDSDEDVIPSGMIEGDAGFSLEFSSI